MKQRSIFESTCGRCGTHWVKGLIRDTLNFRAELPDVHSFSKPYGRIHEYPRAICEKESVDFGGYVYTYHVPLHHLRVLQGVTNILLVVRDPRDVCVSSVHYDFMKEDISKSFEEALQERLSSGASHPLFVESYLEWSEDIEHYLLRFEDMIDDALGQMSKMLNFFGYQYDERVLAQSVKNSSFENLSGGRKPGEEDRASHYRKGKIGDWKNYLTDKDNEIFLEKHGRIMEAWGYV